MSKKLPGNGLLGWLGRQVGYVKRAARTDPASKVVYREGNVEEVEHPHDPGMKLRRTVIDEVIVQAPKKTEANPRGQ